jgi:hypothetical protein
MRPLREGGARVHAVEMYDVRNAMRRADVSRSECR